MNMGSKGITTTDTANIAIVKEEVIPNDIAIVEKEVITEQSIDTLDDIIYDLENNICIGNITIYYSLSLKEFVAIDEDETNEIDKQRIVGNISTLNLYLKNVMINMIKQGKISNKIKVNKANINLMKNAIPGLWEDYSRKHEQIYNDGGLISKFNLFQLTPLLRSIVVEKISEDDLFNDLKDNYKRLYLLFQNNIGDKDADINEKQIKYFLNWISLDINEPEQIRNSILLVGDQGSGKGLLTDCLYKNNIYNKANYAIIDNSTIKDTFNSIFANKAMVVFNEVSTLGQKSSNDIAAKLKQLISDGTFIRRDMRQAGIEVPKHFSMIFTTNTDEPIKIEQEDRRFTIFGRGLPFIHLQCVKDLCEENNETYDDFVKEIKEECKKFVFKIKALDYDINVGNKPLNTKRKEHMINNTNTEEEKLKTIIDKKNYEKFKELLLSLEVDSIDKIEKPNFDKLLEMFRFGVFDMKKLLLIYAKLNNYDLDISHIKKQAQTNSSTFWKRLGLIKLNGGFKVSGSNMSVMVFDEDNSNEKIKILRKIYNKEEIETISIDGKNIDVLLKLEGGEIKYLDYDGKGINKDYIPF